MEDSLMGTSTFFLVLTWKENYLALRQLLTKACDWIGKKNKVFKTRAIALKCLREIAH